MTGQYGQDPRYGPTEPVRGSRENLGWAVAGVLMIVVVVLTGALLVLLLGRGDGGTTASGSPTASSPSTQATEAPIREPTPDPEPTSGRSGPPAATPTARPEPTEAIPVVRLRLEAIGLEDPASPDALDRVIGFTSEGGQQVRVDVSSVSVGEVELCLEHIPTGNGGCEMGAEAVLTGGNDAGPTAWEVVVRGATEGVAATVDLELRFPAPAAQVELRGFRLSGVSGGANGLTAEFRGRGGGPLVFQATWPTPADWLLTVVDQADPAAPHPEISGDATSTSASASTDLIAAGRYRLEFISPTGMEEVHFDATMTLP